MAQSPIPPLDDSHNNTENSSLSDFHSSVETPPTIVTLSGTPASNGAHSPSSSSTRPSPYQHRNSLNLQRSSGCWTCRLRRKKCDEQREEGDSCRTCRRLKLECLGWSPRRPDWMRDKDAVQDYRMNIKTHLLRLGLIRGQPRTSLPTGPSDSPPPPLNLPDLSPPPPPNLPDPSPWPWPHPPSHLHARPKEAEPIIKPKPKRLCDTHTEMHPTLSSWLKNIGKLSNLIDRLQELASATPLDLRRQLYGQVASLRTAFKTQQTRYFEFLRLTEEYANRYLLDISTEIEQQSSFLDKLEKRLDMAKTLYYQADNLRKSYESGTNNVMRSVRETALKQILPSEFDLFREVDFVLGEISQCYKELDKFWKEEICRADTAFRTRRVDPGDVERWRNFKTSLQQTIESWKTNKQGGSVSNIFHDDRPGSSGDDLGAIASSLFPALNALKGWLRRIHESASVEYLNVDLTPILQAEFGLEQNNRQCFTFFRRCVEFGKMVATSPADLMNHLAFSRVRSTGLLERAMALGTDTPDISVENDAPSQGSWKFDSIYKQAVSLQQKTAIGLNALVEIVSNWMVVADSLPDSLPDGFSLGRLRNLADGWEKERASMRTVLAALTDDPAERMRYRRLSSTPSRSLISRLMTKLVSFV